MTKNDMITLIKVNDQIYKIYDGLDDVFGIGPFSNSSFHELTDMILEYTHTTGNDNEEMWHVLTDYNIPVEERYNKMGFDFPDVPR